MDYDQHLEMVRHASWEAFLEARGEARLVLATTAAAASLYDTAFAPGDILLLGRETAGVPDAVHARAGLRFAIPMAAGARSLNVAVAAAMALGEALRQTGGIGQSRLTNHEKEHPA